MKNIKRKIKYKKKTKIDIEINKVAILIVLFKYRQLWMNFVQLSQLKLF